MQTQVREVNNLDIIPILMRDLGTRNIKSVVVVPLEHRGDKWLVTITHS